MRKSVNYLFLAVLFAVFAVLAIGVHFLHSYQMKANAAAMYQQADREIEAANAAKSDPGGRDLRISKLEKAKASLDHYLRYEPDDTEAKIKIAVVLDDLGLEKGNDLGIRGRAFYVLSKLPPTPELRRRQIDIAMAIGKFDEAKNHLLWFREKDDSGAADDEFLLGRCEEFVKTPNLGEAIKHYETSIKLAQKIGAFARVADLYLRVEPKQPELAEQRINEMVEAHVEAYPAYLERARFRLKHHADNKDLLQGALKDIGIARRLSTKDADIFLVGADLLSLLDKKDEASAWLQEGLKHHPKNVRCFLSLVTLQARDGKIDQALKTIDQALNEVSPNDHNQLLHFQADLYISKAQSDKADEVIQRLRAANYAPALMDYLQARVHINRGQWSQGERLLLRIRKYLDDVPLMAKQADQMLGLCAENLGNPDQQLSYFESALKFDPKSLAAQFGMGKALLAKGQHEEALEYFRKLIMHPDAPPATHLLLARALLLRNLRLPADKRQWAELDDQLTKAAEKLPDAVDMHVLRAEVLLIKDVKNLEAAREILLKAREAAPEQTEYWIGLANLAAREKPDKTYARSLEILDEAEKQKLTDPTAVTLARIRYVVRLPKLEALQRLAKIEIEREGASEKRIRLLAGLADAYYGLGEHDEAIRLWNQLKAAQPNNLAVRLLLYDLASARGKDDEMVALLHEIREVEGENGIYWRYGRAGREVRLARPKGKEPLSEDGQARLGVAGAHLKEIGKLRPTWYRVPALEGEIKEIEGKPDEAIKRYQKALDLGDRRPLTVRKLVELLNNSGQYKEAGLVLKELAGNEADLISVGLGKAIVERMIIDNEIKGALEIALQAVPPNSKDHRDHIWLGRVYQELKEFDKAKESYALACQLSPTAAESWVYYVRFLIATAQKEEVTAALAAAEKSIDPERKALAMAHLHETRGSLDKAEQFHLDALKAKPTDLVTLQSLVSFYHRANQYSKTEPYLRTILQQVDKAPDRANWLNWTRRSLAIVVALKNPGNHRKLKEAEALLNDNDIKPLQPVEDKRARALILSSHPAYRSEAIELHHQLPSLDATERLRLAQLYLADGKWRMASDHLVQVLKETEKEKNALHYTSLATYARVLLANDKTKIADVQRLLRGIDGEMAKAFFVKELRARALKLEGRNAEVVELLTAHATAVEGDTGLVAGLLDQLEFPAEAEAHYRVQLKKAPSAAGHLALAEFLGRRLRAADALKECEQALALGAPERTAAVAAGVVRAAKSQPDLFAPADKLLQECLAKSKSPIPVLLALADLRDQQKLYPESIKHYNEILTKHSPDHAIALNNLAWILTFSGGDKKVALQHIDKAIDLLGPLAELLDTRGTVYLHLDRPKEAIADLHRAKTIGESAVRYFHLAQAQHKALATGDAANSFGKALKLGLNESQLHPLERPAFQALQMELQKK